LSPYDIKPKPGTSSGRQQKQKKKKKQMKNKTNIADQKQRRLPEEVRQPHSSYQK
jgi:hypothetical protein